MTGRVRLLANWRPREPGVPWDLQASEPCLQSALAWSPGQAAGHLRVSWRDFGGLVHLLPNWDASTRGCYLDARW
jgi:hypothetical protein